jgi:hypothetical protein
MSELSWSAREKKVNVVPDDIAPGIERMARNGVDLIAAIDESIEAMTADEAGRASYKDSFHER